MQKRTWKTIEKTKVIAYWLGRFSQKFVLFSSQLLFEKWYRVWQWFKLQVIKRRTDSCKLFCCVFSQFSLVFLKVSFPQTWLWKVFYQITKNVVCFIRQLYNSYALLNLRRTDHMLWRKNERFVYISLRKPKVFVSQILRGYLKKKGRIRKFFYCLREPCVRKFGGLARSKILEISQTNITKSISLSKFIFLLLCDTWFAQPARNIWPLVICFRTNINRLRHTG